MTKESPLCTRNWSRLMQKKLVQNLFRLDFINFTLNNEVQNSWLLLFRLIYLHCLV
jgi:hypothetical protein